MSLPRWSTVTLFDDPDEERRVAAMRDALRGGTFDETELTLGTPPGFATLLTDPPPVPRRYDSHGLESDDGGPGPFDALKRYAEATRHEALSLRDAPAGTPAEAAEDPLGPVTMNPRLFPKRPQGPVSRGIKTFANETVGQAAGGVSEAVHNALRVLPGVEALEKYTGYQEPKFAKAETAAGQFIRDTSRFLTGFIPALRVARMAGVAHASIRAAGAANALTQNPIEENLADLLDKHAVLRRPVYEFLKDYTGADDKSIKRLENALEGAALSALLESAGPALRWTADKLDIPAFSKTIATLTAHATVLVGAARSAGTSVEALIMNAARGGKHTLGHKAMHGLAPHTDDHSDVNEPPK